MILKHRCHISFLPLCHCHMLKKWINETRGPFWLLQFFFMCFICWAILISQVVFIWQILSRTPGLPFWQNVVWSHICFHLLPQYLCCFPKKLKLYKTKKKSKVSRLCFSCQQCICFSLRALLVMKRTTCSCKESISFLLELTQEERSCN